MSVPHTTLPVTEAEAWALRHALFLWRERLPEEVAAEFDDLNRRIHLAAAQLQWHRETIHHAKETFCADSPTPITPKESHP